MHLCGREEPMPFVQDSFSCILTNGDVDYIIAGVTLYRARSAHLTTSRERRIRLLSRALIPFR